MERSGVEEVRVTKDGNGAAVHVRMVVEQTGVVVEKEGVRKAGELGGVEVTVQDRKNAYMMKGVIGKILEEEIAQVEVPVRVSVAFYFFGDRHFVPLVESLNEVLEELRIKARYAAEEERNNGVTRCKIFRNEKMVYHSEVRDISVGC